MQKLGSRQYAIIVLTALTALIHLYLVPSFLPNPLGYAFILNGIGYITLLVALYFISSLAQYRSTIRWLLLLFTAVTFVLYFVINWPNPWFTIGIVTKTIELVLIILLWLDRG